MFDLGWTDVLKTTMEDFAKLMGKGLLKLD